MKPMTREEFEALGDVHKAFEREFTQERLTPGFPIVARLDGRAFHTFTRGLERPYDAAFASCMEEVACYLVANTQADVAYRQSDEITLAWNNQPKDGVPASMLFDGRTHKLVSILAAMASVKFHEALSRSLPQHADKLPVFDARVFQYPTLELAAESFAWRECDAVRNSIAMLAQAHFPEGQLHKTNNSAKLELLESIGVRWADQPEVFRRGVYVKRALEWKELTSEELERIPEARRPKEPVQRSVVKPFPLPPATSIHNLAGVLFFGEEALVQLSGRNPLRVADTLLPAH